MLEKGDKMQRECSQEAPVSSGKLLPWKDVEAELGTEEANKLHAETEQELLSLQFKEKVLVKMSHGEVVQHKSHALFVLGPSASGKTTLLKQAVADIPQGAITVDGSTIRDCSEVWRRTVQRASDRGLSGFSNYFQNDFKGPADRLKHSIMDNAINNRANVVVPETASNVQGVIDMVDRFLAAGYRLSFVATIAVKHVCEERGRSREAEEGKKFSSKNWKNSVQAILTVQEHLVSRGVVQQTGNVRIFDNSPITGPVEVSFETIKQLLADDGQSSAIRRRGGWCETRLLAGIYSGQQGQRTKILPANFEDEEVEVTIVASTGETQTMRFDVATCKCGSYQLTVNSQGRPVLSSDQGALEYVESIAGMSLRQSLESIADVLRGTNFLGSDAEFRPMSDKEYQAATDACRVTGPEAAPSRDQPSALFVVSPSGGGKTTVLKNFAAKFGVHVEESVVADGAIFRDCHPQYDELIKSGHANGGIWYSAWPAVKKVVSNAKKQIIDSAMKAKQDLCISDTGSDLMKLTRLIEKLKAVGYKVHMLGVFAEPQTIITRGVEREVEEGKRYIRDVKKLCTTFDNFAPAIQTINGNFCLVNAQGKSPQLFKDGAGGMQITFNLKEALASMAEMPLAKLSTAKEVEVAKVSHGDFSYIMEGNLNIVCAYNGQNEDWKNMVLRVRKGDNSTYKTDVRFAKGVAARMLGNEYVDTGDLIYLEPSDVKALDEAIQSSRPPKRRRKHLDTEVRDTSGAILATKVANLMAAPIDVPMVTVELKPKCGLQERQGLPSRYKLLQFEKLKQGKIEKLSEYDPIKLLSGSYPKIHETLTDCMHEPQNNLRVFIDGKAVFDEEILRNSTQQLAKENLQAKLQAAGINGIDCLMSILSGILSSPAMLMPARLKRIQSWAAGETAHIANALLKLLRDRFGDACSEMLSRVENFELAIENLEDFPCDEEGIAKATELMDDVLTQAHKRWDADIETQVIRWLCRFLLGRTCHDVSVLVNFIQLPDTISTEEEHRLRRLRYRPLDFFGVPGSLSWTGLWYRTSVIDTDAKPADKIPEYATQLDDYAAAYYSRFEIPKNTKFGDGATEGQEAVGGHDDSISFEGSTVWKVDQGGARGQMELAFLRHCLHDPAAKGIVPALAGYRVNNGKEWVGMENILHGLNDPAILDIKMGTRTWNTNSSKAKEESQSKKAMESTTGKLGVRVVGGKLKNPEGELLRVGYKNHKDVVDEAGLKETLGQFFCTPALLQTTIVKIKEVQKFWTSHTAYAFYASSLLFAYDIEKKDECRVAMIDFANAEQISQKSEDLSGYDIGVATLLRVLSQPE